MDHPLLPTICCTLSPFQPYSLEVSTSHSTNISLLCIFGQSGEFLFPLVSNLIKLLLKLIKLKTYLK
jgi:hypothetical protein